MKRITLLLVCLIGLTGFVQAQEVKSSSQIDELLNRMEQIQDNAGSVSDYFTQEEQRVLRNYFSTTNTLGNTDANSRNVAQLAYAINNDSGMYGTFDTADPSTFNPIATSGVDPSNFEQAGAVDPDDPNTIYVFDNANHLFSVDVTTGDYTAMGEIVAPGGEEWLGLEYDLTDGTLYGVSAIINTSSTLSIIDIGAKTATPVGSSGALDVMGAISVAIDGSGVVYIHDIVDDLIYTANKTTGVGTLLGDADFDANFGQGMAYDSDNDVIYLAAFNATDFQAELRTLDTSTGATTLVGQMSSGSAQFAWVSFEGIIAGIGENALEGVSYYPNPASDILNLSSVDTIKNVVIYNVLGQKVMDQTIGNTTTQLNVSALRSGTYIMKVSVQGEVGTYKVTIK